MNSLLKAGLSLAVLTVLILALMPSPPAVLALQDPAKHAAGMALLTFIYALSYPDFALPRVLLVVACASLALEIFQGALPFGRALDMYDWLAGLAGSFLTASALGLARQGFKMATGSVHQN